MRKAFSLATGLALCGALTLPVTAAADNWNDPVPPQALQMIERINAGLEASGSPLRLTEASFFTLGRGINSFRLLRIGSRWTTSNLTYVIDESDYTPDVPASETEAAMASSYDSWTAISNTTLSLSRVADDGGNHDILDGMVLNSAGQCVDIVDTTSPNLVAYNPATGGFALNPEADIVMGGWLPSAYFSNCMGSASILGITFGFSSGQDSNGDNYPDHVYVEQFYNDGFTWTTTDSVYLGFDAPMDIESVAVHENGHALGLDHFGGPNPNQPFKLQPNGKVFDPEAVMNAFYLGGDDKRTPLGTDQAALRTLFGNHGN